MIDQFLVSFPSQNTQTYQDCITSLVSEEEQAVCLSNLEKYQREIDPVDRKLAGYIYLGIIPSLYYNKAVSIYIYWDIGHEHLIPSVISFESNNEFLPFSVLEEVFFEALKRIYACGFASQKFLAQVGRYYLTNS